jgi:hypothetical protein
MKGLLIAVLVATVFNWISVQAAYVEAKKIRELLEQRILRVMR